MTAPHSTAETATHNPDSSSQAAPSPQPATSGFDFSSPELPSEGELAAESPDSALPGLDGASDSAEASPEPETGEGGRPARKKLEEQLEALKRKEFELRRALAIADHPELADAVRVIEGRAFQISRVEAKLAQGLSKSEERRRDTIEKKLGSLREKRAELDAQIGALESELGALGAERAVAYEAERRHALEQLLVALSTYEAQLQEAGMDASGLVPEIARWLPEIETLAESLIAARPSA